LENKASRQKPFQEIAKNLQNLPFSFSRSLWEKTPIS